MPRTPKPCRWLEKKKASYQRKGHTAKVVTVWRDGDDHHELWIERHKLQGPLTLLPHGKPYGAPYSRLVPTGLDWPDLRQKLSTSVWELDPHNPGEVCRRVGLGNCWPSGKHYAFWTSNQTKNDVARDERFNETLDHEAEENGLGIEWNDGYPYVFEQKDVSDLVPGDMVAYGHVVWTIVPESCEDNDHDITSDNFITMYAQTEREAS
jgi:hypothetical protein